MPATAARNTVRARGDGRPQQCRRGTRDCGQDDERARDPGAVCAHGQAPVLGRLLPLQDLRRGPVRHSVPVDPPPPAPCAPQAVRAPCQGRDADGAARRLRAPPRLRGRDGEGRAHDGALAHLQRALERPPRERPRARGGERRRHGQGPLGGRGDQAVRRLHRQRPERVVALHAHPQGQALRHPHPRDAPRQADARPGPGLPAAPRH
mmetsp:Transcript_11685/g.30239  ORF Transcript_11685/g.30239 Transcript_11685/m.30239 type:complete len:207 (+) Transcript_11685:412-1032(+)